MYSKKKFVFFVFLILFLFPEKVEAQVVINEIVPDSSLEWIELYNSSPSAEYLKNYYIDDDTDFDSDAGSSVKKILSDINISSNTFPFFETSSFLNNSGDWVVLFNSSGVVLDQYQYTSNPGSEVSIGRYPDSSGSFSKLTSLTKGYANTVPITPSPSSTTTSTPASTPTPSSTSSPTKTPTITPTTKPTSTKTPTPKPSPSPKDGDDQLEKNINVNEISVVNMDLTPSPKGSVAGISTSKKFPFTAVGLIVSGLGFVGYAFYGFYLKAKKKYT